MSKFGENLAVVTLPNSANYFSKVEPYLRRNFWIRVRQEIVFELIGDAKGKRILDLGCGNGAVSLPLSDVNEIVLVDNSPAMIDAARVNARNFNERNCKIILGDAAELDLGTFDIVLAIGLLAHVRTNEEILAGMSRHLNAGGLGILQFSPGERFLNRVGLALLQARGRAYRPMRTSEVLDAVARNGFVPIDERNHVLLVPGMQRLLGPLLVSYDRIVRRHSSIAMHGTETVLLVRKS
jgi:ubiquinone/menaquinone biosynthesis C-methylase UbiE